MFLPVGVVPAGLFHLGNPVRSGAHDPWQRRVLVLFPMSTVPLEPSAHPTVKYAQVLLWHESCCLQFVLATC